MPPSGESPLPLHQRLRVGLLPGRPSLAVHGAPFPGCRGQAGGQHSTIFGRVGGKLEERPPTPSNQQVPPTPPLERHRSCAPHTFYVDYDAQTSVVDSRHNAVPRRHFHKKRTTGTGCAAGARHTNERGGGSKGGFHSIRPVEQIR
jgi:hypothetical protein